MKQITSLITTGLLLMMLTSCSSSKSVGENPFFSQWETPYGVPPFDLIKTDHFKPAFERAMSLNNAEIEAITSNKETPTFENTILVFDNSGQMLTQVYLVFGMLSSAETNNTMQALKEEMMPMLSAHSDKIGMDEKLFKRIESVYNQRNDLNLTAEQSRLLQKIYDEFVRSGAALSASDKARLQEINSELSIASVKFGNNILAENNNFILELSATDLAGLPSGVRDIARDKAEAMGKKDKWVFTLHKPSWIPFLTNSSNRQLREQIYKGYLNRGNNNDQYDNKALINDFIRLRTEKANLLGFPSYAAYVTADEMSGTPNAVYSLLDQIWTPALDRAKGELEEMNQIFQRENPGETFESWDWWYYAEKLRKQNYALDEEMLRPYFSLESVQAGIFYLANRLFGITFQPIIVPIYHPDVIAFRVLDSDQSHIGVLYFDYFPRAGKGQGAWCGNYVEQTYKEGERVPPVVSIVCNFTPPTRNTPSLLTLDETETLFHEFGHALHFLFHDVKYRGLTDVEGDFVELPSQIMENWAFEPEMLRQYAVHYRTGDVIPQHLVDKLRKTTLFNQGFTTTELVAAALSDMDIHSTKVFEPFDPPTLERKLLNDERGLIPQIEPRYRYTYFRHIFDGGYSAGYYFYIWAEVLDKDAYEAFRQSGDIFNKRIASDFRTKILERGGSEAGMTMYRAFRGADPDKTAMLKGRGLWNEPDPEPAEEIMQN